MTLFKNITDDLLSSRGTAFEGIRNTICELVDSLKIASYKDMVRDDRDVQAIVAKEKVLRTFLARPALVNNSVIDAPWAVKKSFLLAHRLTALYPLTVGSPDQVISSVQLKTFPRFKPAYSPPTDGALAYKSLSKELQLSKEDELELQSLYEKSASKISKKRSIISAIRKQIVHSDGTVEPAEVIRLYGILFGNHPFLEGELELVVTETALYFWMSSIEGFLEKVKTSLRSTAEQENAIRYVKSVRKFRFENFSHFPVFAFFEARNADPKFIEEIKRDSLGPDSQFEELLNSVIAVEEAEKIEKYLIHDSWGHIWEDDLTKVKEFYDDLVLLSLPLAPDHIVFADEGKINITDVIKITSSGEVAYDENRALKYVDGIIEQRVTAFLTPLCAELCADIIEYQFVASLETGNSKLPSSSLFRVNPTKLDFAWTDIHFFSAHLLRSLLIYESNKSLRANFVERVALLVKSRSTRFANATGEAFSDQVNDAVNSFLSLLATRTMECCDTTLPTSSSQMNEFFLLFTNLLQIQSTINCAMEDVIDKSHPELKHFRETLVIALLTYFCEAPLSHFWNMDEMFAEWAIPFLKVIEKTEAGLLK